MVKSDLAVFWKQKEEEWGRTISVYEVAKTIDAAWETISNLKEGRTERFDSHVIGRICQYFEVPEGALVPFLKVRYTNGDEEIA